jgi:ABC-2 type transport system ATP-binding protein
MSLFLNNLSISTPNSLPLLRNVNHEFQTGITAVLGSNGAGKSTLLRAIATTYPILNGNILIGKIDSKRQRAAYLECLMFLPQTFFAYPELTASEFLQYFLRLRGASTQQANQISTTWLLKVNMQAAANLLIGTFSQGMLQRLGLAYVMQVDVPIYVLDEPFAGVDSENREILMNLLYEQGKRKVIIISTHHIDEMRHMCTNVVRVDNENLTR